MAWKKEWGNVEVSDKVLQHNIVSSLTYTFLQIKLKYALCSLKYFTKYKIKANHSKLQLAICLLASVNFDPLCYYQQ
jgi:hypothetical protein